MYKLPLTAAAVVMCFLALPACETTERADPSGPPAPTFRGPEFLHGTIGSLTTIEGYDPILVSGYGLVVGLDGTGSADAPPALRQWLLDEMSKRGFGRFETGYENLRPEEVFASDSTAVVLIEGIIPPGAPRETRFDLIISALSATQTTSVQGGTLYTSDLAIGGRNFRPTAVNALARGRGPVFSSPFVTTAEAELETDITDTEDPRMGRILAGGVTVEDVPLRLVTTRPSYLNVRRIADRINGAFPPAAEDAEPIAVPRNDSVIDLNVTRQFKGNPRRMLEIIAHLDMNPQQAHARQRAEMLVELLEDDENAEHFEAVVYAFKGMGRPMVDYLRELYEHPEERVRLAALSAASYLRDTRAATPLIELAGSNPSDDVLQATELLGRLLRQRPDFARVAEFLQRQLDHDDPQVRVAAYEALADVEHRAVQRFGFERKMELAHAHAGRPMVHMTQRGVPRIIVFGSRIAMDKPLFFSAWGNRFMLNADPGDEEIGVFYQPRGASAIRTAVPNNLIHLVGAMAYTPDADSQTIGLDMSYSEVAYILHRLQDEGFIDTPIMLEETDYTQRIIASRGSEEDQQVRPETGDRDEAEEDLTPAILTDDQPLLEAGEQEAPPSAP